MSYYTSASSNAAASSSQSRSRPVSIVIRPATAGPVPQQRTQSAASIASSVGSFSQVDSRPRTAVTPRDLIHSRLHSVKRYRRRDLFAAHAQRTQRHVRQVREQAAARCRSAPRRAAIAHKEDIPQIFIEPHKPIQDAAAPLSNFDGAVFSKVDPKLARIWSNTRKSEQAMKKLDQHTGEATHNWGKERAKLEAQSTAKYDSAMLKRERPHSPSATTASTQPPGPKVSGSAGHSEMPDGHFCRHGWSSDGNPTAAKDSHSISTKQWDFSVIEQADSLQHRARVLPKAKGQKGKKGKGGKKGGASSGGKKKSASKKSKKPGSAKKTGAAASAPVEVPDVPPNVSGVYREVDRAYAPDCTGITAHPEETQLRVHQQKHSEWAEHAASLPNTPREVQPRIGVYTTTNRLSALDAIRASSRAYSRTAGAAVSPSAYSIPIARPSTSSGVLDRKHNMHIAHPPPSSSSSSSSSAAAPLSSHHASAAFAQARPHTAGPPVHLQRRQAMMQCDSMRMSLARRGVRTTRNTLEQALVAPDVSIAQKTRSTYFPRPWSGLPRDPTGSAKKAKGKKKGKKGKGKGKKKKGKGKKVKK
jgi:hypothetical protein